MEEVLKQIVKMQQEQQQHNMALHELMKNLATAKASEKSVGKSDNVEFLIEALASNITEFNFDEHNLTFEMWFARYEDLFEVDAAKLDDAAKVRLLLRKLNTVVHNKYTNFILPKHARDLSFRETVIKLTELFGTQTSQFNIRYNCLQTAKDSQTDFVTYAGIVNKQCEQFKLRELSLDQFKCLIFVMGLKSSADFDIRTKLLSKIDHEESTVTLDSLTRECQRLLNLKTDTVLIESSKTEPHVNQLQTDKKKKKGPKYPCWFCGGMHFARECSYKKHKCELCNVVGHKAGYCSVVKKNHKNAKTISKCNKNNKTKAETRSISFVNKINVDRKYVTIEINNKVVELQFDTASDITLISEETFQKLQITNAVQVKQAARSATGKLPLSLQFDCNVKFRNRHAYVTCYVTKIRNLNLLGLDWIKALQLDDMSINTICNNVVIENQESSSLLIDETINHLKSCFPDVFDGKFGLCTKTKAHLTIKPNTQPVFRSKRPVAYAVKHLVEEELKRLQDIGIISPVNYSDWAAPIVVIKKANGSVRICADFSTGLNEALENHQYPLPLPEDIFSKLANAKYFSHIDLSDAFLQIEVDDESKHLLTITTHKGLYRYNRMVFGVKTFPAIFQQIMDKMLAGLENVAAYIDDIFVSGKDEKEHHKNLQNVLCRIQDYGLKVKFSKCKFFVEQVKYLGYVINRDGLQPDPQRISAITQMPKPSNISELRSFLGAVNFYGKFVNNMRQLPGPLDNLLKSKVKWHWTKEHDNCFTKIKEVLTSKLLLTHYDPKRDIIVAADASQYGLGACIFHKYPDNSVKAICHASRALTPTEKSYSQIEKEGLALVFAVTKFHKMIYGRKFTLHTDHKPLLAIFGKKSGIAVHQANRLQRWAVKLLAYDFDISFVSTTSFGYADVLSRLISKNNSEAEDYVIAAVKFENEIKTVVQNNLQNLPLTNTMIKYESSQDNILRLLLNYIENGWPTEIKDPELKAFYNRRNNLSIVEGIIMFGERVVVPNIFRKRLLKLVHRGHPGIERSKAIARSYVYWPNIDEHIKIMVQNCGKCATASKMPTKTALKSWPIPSEPWERLHIDYAGPIDGYYFLVLVDALSKWPEIVMTKSITAQQTVQILEEIFSRFGLPKTLVSDNGTQFTSAYFTDFMIRNGIEHLKSSPYYPMSNGQAERFVDTLKRSLQKLDGEGTISQNLQTFLQNYRSTPNPHSPKNLSPAEVLFGRKIRLTLDLIKPCPEKRVPIRNTAMENQFNRKQGAKETYFSVQENVYARVYKNNKDSYWLPGRIIERIGNVMYNVLLRSGKLIRVHTNQIKKNYDKNRNEDFNKNNCDAFGILDEPGNYQTSRERVNSDNSQLGTLDTPQLRRSQRERKPVDRFIPG